MAINNKPSSASLCQEAIELDSSLVADFILKKLTEDLVKPIIIFGHPFMASGVEYSISAFIKQGCEVYVDSVSEHLSSFKNSVLPQLLHSAAVLTQTLEKINKNRHIIYFGEPNSSHALFGNHENCLKLDEAFQAGAMTVIGSQQAILTSEGGSLNSSFQLINTSLMYSLSSKMNKQFNSTRPQFQSHLDSNQVGSKQAKTQNEIAKINQVINSLNKSQTLEQQLSLFVQVANPLFDVGGSVFSFLLALNAAGNMPTLNPEQLNLIAKGAIGDSTSYASSFPEKNYTVVTGETAWVNAYGFHLGQYDSAHARHRDTVILNNQEQKIENDLCKVPILSHTMGSHVPVGAINAHILAITTLDESVCGLIQSLENRKKRLQGEQVPSLLLDFQLNRLGDEAEFLNNSEFAKRLPGNIELAQKIATLDQCFGEFTKNTAPVQYYGCSAFEWIEAVTTALGQRYQAFSSDQHAIMTAIQQCKGEQELFGPQQSKEVLVLFLNSMFPNRLSDGLQDIFNGPESNRILCLVIKDAPVLANSLYQLQPPHNPWLRPRADIINMLASQQVYIEHQLKRINGSSPQFECDLKCALEGPGVKVIVISLN